MKQVKISLFLCFYLSLIFQANAQSTYNYSNYAAAGDTLFLTSATFSGLDFTTTGTNMIWDYSALNGVSQKMLRFRLPTQTGFTTIQWPYIQNSSNVNLSSTDGTTLSVGAIQYSDMNDYFLGSSTQLAQKATASKLSLNGVQFSIKSVYSAPDILYKFPVNYGNSPDSSVSSYTSSVPGIYYHLTEIHRKNTVNGWGTLTTPYGTFSNTLRYVTEVMQIDTMAFDTIGIPKDTTWYREIQWLNPSHKYPLLTVHQTLIGTNYVTQSAVYLDNQQYYQPNALFAYFPIQATMGDTVTFQNLSTNATSYAWNFNDPVSTSNTSTATNPQHPFANPGTYNVQLIAFNGPLSDTVVIPVTIFDTLPPVAAFTWNPVPVFVDDSVQFTNNSTGALYYNWNFGDSINTPTTSVQINPVHVYPASGTYSVRLIASDASGSDTLILPLIVYDTLVPVADFAWNPDTIFVGDIVQFTNLSIHASTYNWNFGDPSSSFPTSLLTDPSHVFASSGIYSVTLIAENMYASDTIVYTLTVYDTLLPVADFSWNPITIYSGNTVQFSNLSSNATTFTWNFGDPGSGTDTSFASNPVHVFASAGQYTVMLISADNFHADTIVHTLEVIDSIGTAGLNDLPETTISIYPNPVTSMLTIQHLPENSNIHLTDLSGKELKFEFVSTNELNIEALPAGNYLITITTDTQTCTKLFFKE